MTGTSITSKFLRHPRFLILGVLGIVGLLSGSNAFCQEAQSQPLSADQVQEYLNDAGYAPLWQIQRNATGYTVEGIDPSGNPVLLKVDPFSADIVALESLALLR